MRTFPHLKQDAGRQSKNNSVFLIITEDSPGSYSPAGERVRNMALVFGSTPRKAVVLALGSIEKGKKHRPDSSALLYSVRLLRATPYPISAFLDTVKLLVLLVHGFILGRRYKPSYIVGVMPPFETGASSWLLSKFLGIRLVIDLMDDWEASVEWNLTHYIPLKLWKLLFNIATYIYSSATCILAVTSIIAETVRRRDVHAPIVLVPEGADTSIFFPRKKAVRDKIRLSHGLPKNRIVVVYSGSITQYYRLDLIVKSAESLPDNMKEKFFFLFYLYRGVEHIKNMKKQLRLSDDMVDVRGPLPRRKLSEVLAACDVGLVPFDDKKYLLCARSTKLYEYLSTGLYVISSGPEGGELDSFFSQHPDCGTFVPPRVEDFARIFPQIVENTASLFGDKCRNSRLLFIRENHDRKKIMGKAVAYLSNIKGASK